MSRATCDPIHLLHFVTPALGLTRVIGRNIKHNLAPFDPKCWYNVWKMNKDNLPYVFSVVFYVEFGDRPQLNAFWILPIFSHFQASLATQTLKNKSQIVFDGQCQKWSRLLASNDLKWRREFSNEDLRPKTPWTKTKTALTKTKTPWTKTTDANRCGQCPLS